jgi:hypothetical protein
VPVQAGAGKAEARTSLALGFERLEWRPQGLGDRRLKPTARPRVIWVDPPEAVPDGEIHAGVVTGASSSLSVRCGSRSGAISGSEAGSGISMTLTGLLVNPMIQPSFSH